MGSARRPFAGLWAVLAGSGLLLGAAGARTPSAGAVLASIGPGGHPGNGESDEGAVTPNGRYAAFLSFADDLAPADPATTDCDIYLRDTKTGTTTLVSRGIEGGEGNGNSIHPCISASGRVVVYPSLASNLVSPDRNDANYDIFRTDTRTGETREISLDAEGNPAGASCMLYGACLSSNGRYTVFESSASNLRGTEEGGSPQVFLHDAVRGTVTLVSRAGDGSPANDSCLEPAIAPNGRWVVYRSFATNLGEEDGQGVRTVTRLFLFDVRHGRTTLLAPAMDGGDPEANGTLPVVSSSGRRVAFLSTAADLVAGDANLARDVFVTDTRTGEVRRISTGPEGVEADAPCFSVAMSASGRVVVFDSLASNLVPGDDNGASDVFRWDERKGTPVLVTRSATGGAADGGSFISGAALSSNGKWAAVNTAATNLVDGVTDDNGDYDTVLLRVP